MEEADFGCKGDLANTCWPRPCCSEKIHTHSLRKATEREVLVEDACTHLPLLVQVPTPGTGELRKPVEGAGHKLQLTCQPAALVK